MKEYKTACWEADILADVSDWIERTSNELMKDGWELKFVKPFTDGHMFYVQLVYERNAQ